MRVAYHLLQAITGLIALLFLVMGLQWLVVPENMSDQFGLLPNGILGWATMRADLGGFFLVTSITAALAASGWRGANHYLFCCALLMSFAALGRLIGFATDGVPDDGFTPFIFELFTVTVLVGLATTRSRFEAANK